MQLLNKRVTCFLELASCLSFSTAAENLNITQQAVTYQIAELEKELGVILFIRTTRHVSLTQAGRVMRDEFVRIRRSVDSAVRKIREVEAFNYATITIGFLSSLSRSQVINPVLRALQAKFPDVFFAVKLCDFIDLRNSLFDGEIELCVAGCTDWATWPSTESTVLRSDPLVLVCGPDSSLDREIQNTPNHLPTREIMERHPLLKVPDDVHIGDGPDYSFIPCADTVTVPDMNTMLIHIASGIGFACLTQLFSGSSSGEFRLYPAPFEPHCIDLITARRADTKSPMVLEVEKEIVRVLTPQPADLG